MQAQNLGANSQIQANQLGAQAGLQAQNLGANSQIQANNLAAQAGMQGQQLSAQSALQAMQQSLQAQMANQTAGMNQYGANLQAGTAAQNQAAQMAQFFPNAFNQNYAAGIAGAQAANTAIGQPQQLDIASLRNQQDFLVQLMGGMPRSATSTQSGNPGILGGISGGLLTAGMLGNTSLGRALGGALGTAGTAGANGISSLWNSLFGPSAPPPDFSGYGSIDPGDFGTDPIDLSGILGSASTGGIDWGGGVLSDWQW